MSLSSRLKERREQLKLKQSDVAQSLGITPSAIANYENGVSTPKADILFKIFDVLKCDANYLFQDEMSDNTYQDKATPKEIEKIKKYRDLDNHGKEMVDFTLEKEWERSIELKKEKELTYISDYTVPEYIQPIAAHTDDTSEENIKAIEEEFEDFDNLP